MSHFAILFFVSFSLPSKIPFTWRDRLVLLTFRLTKCVHSFFYLCFFLCCFRHNLHNPRTTMGNFCSFSLGYHYSHITLFVFLYSFLCHSTITSVIKGERIRNFVVHFLEAHDVMDGLWTMFHSLQLFTNKSLRVSKCRQKNFWLAWHFCFVIIFEKKNKITFTDRLILHHLKWKPWQPLNCVSVHSLG